jgi:hypothetical protein
MIADKVMKNYSRGECTLDVSFIVEFCKQGAPLNWCKYFLTKMLQACIDMHEQSTWFYLWLPIGHIHNVEMEASIGS